MKRRRLVGLGLALTLVTLAVLPNSASARSHRHAHHHHHPSVVTISPAPFAAAPFFFQSRSFFFSAPQGFPYTFSGPQGFPYTNRASTFDTAPQPQWVWLPGSWQWDGFQWVWVPGRWVFLKQGLFLRNPCD